MPLRAIIVGAGLSGLIASHCLCHAGIDHIVLEKRPGPAPAAGASIAIFPSGARILHQLGLLDALKQHCVPLETANVRLPNGRVLYESKLPTHVRERHGEDILLLDRQQLLRILFEQLPQPTVHFSKKVTTIRQDDDGVLVSLADGSTEAGHAILGCDGVYSQTRAAMWKRASDEGRPLGDERAISTDWQCLAGVSAPQPGLGRAALTTVLGPGRSLLFNTQPDATYFFVLQRLPRRTYLDEPGRYSAADTAAFARAVADCPVTRTTTFRQIWDARRRAQLVPVEEGILRTWHDGRIVLVGDAAHKMTPNSGFGGNACIESAVVLCNKLAALRDAGPVTAAALAGVFRAYHEERFARCDMLVQASGAVTRLQAWETIWAWVKSTWVAQYGYDEDRANALAQVIKSAPRVAGLSTEGLKCGSVPWDDEEGLVDLNEGREVDAKARGRSVGVPLKMVGVVAVVAVSLVALRRFVPKTCRA